MRKPTKIQKKIMIAAGFDTASYAVIGDRNGLLIIVSRSDDRNVIRIDKNSQKRIPG